MNFKLFLENLHESTGTLEYGPGIRAVLWIEQEIVNYYFKLIPPYKEAKPQMYKAHITVVRLAKEKQINMELWGKYQGENIQFQYDNKIQFDGIYFYLDAYSKRIGEIRQELGLPVYRHGFNSYHISIANRKVKL